MSRRGPVALTVLVLATASCSLVRGSSGDAAGQLRSLAAKGVAAAYSVTYRYTQSGKLAPGQTTRLEIAQLPPNSLRKLETVSPAANSEPVTVRSWQATTGGKNYACTDYADVGVRCVEDPLARSMFGSAQLDAFFDVPRIADAYAAVGKATRTVRLLGEVATCFQAVEPEPTPVPVRSPQPAFTPERFRFELCYAEDGILLRGLRTIEGQPSGPRFVVQAVEVSRRVRPSELRLPGPVTSPEDIH